MNENEAGVDIVAHNTQQFLDAMDKVSRAFEGLNSQINETATKIASAGDKIDKAGDEMGGVAKDIDKVGDSANKAGDEAAQGLKKIPNAAEDAAQKTSKSGDFIKGVFQGIGMAALNMAADAGRATLDFAVDSIKLAGDFEAGMNRFKVAAGQSLDAKGIQEFEDLIIDIGVRLPVSTMEVQDAATTLIKGGLDPMILKMGGLESAIKFAAAANMDLEGAAELSVKTLGTFTNAMASAEEQADFLAHAQNMLLKVDGASASSVEDLGNAMLLAGGTAKAAGVDYDDFATTMGLIVPAFKSAEQAGTSYKNFLVRLIPTTNPAKDAMHELGLMTFQTADAIKTLNANGIDPTGMGVLEMKKALFDLATANGASEKEANKWLAAFDKSAFYDLEGNFVGNAKAAQLLQDATKDLSEAERVHALQTIFGNDAMNAAVALADSGKAGYDKFAASVASASGVQETAEGVQQGFNIALNNFEGTVEAVRLKIFKGLLPVLTELFNNTLSPAIATIGKLADAFGALDTQTTAVDQTFVAMDESLATASANFEFVGNTVERIMGKIWGVVEQVLGLVSEFWAENGEMIMTNVAEVWETISFIISDVLEIILFIVDKVFGDISKFLDKNGDDLIKFFSNLWKVIFGIIDTALKLISNVLNVVLLALKGDWKGAWEAMKQTVYDLLTGVVTIIQNILNTILGLFGTSLEQLNRDVIRLFTTIVVSIGNEVGKAVTAVENFFIRFNEAGRTLINKIREGIDSVAGNVATGISNAINGALQFAGDLPSKIIQYGKDVVGKIVDGIVAVASDIGTAVGNAVTGAIDDAIAAIEAFIANPFGGFTMPDFNNDGKPGSYKGVQAARSPYVYNPFASGGDTVSTTYQLNVSTQQSEASLIHQYNVMRAMAR